MIWFLCSVSSLLVIPHTQPHVHYFFYIWIFFSWVSSYWKNAFVFPPQPYASITSLKVPWAGRLPSFMKSFLENCSLNVLLEATKIRRNNVTWVLYPFIPLTPIWHHARHLLIRFLFLKSFYVLSHVIDRRLCREIDYSLVPSVFPFVQERFNKCFCSACFVAFLKSQCLWQENPSWRVF